MHKIAIHSVPRSGSSWLGNIFNSHPKVIFKYQPLFSYAFKDYLNINSSEKEIELFFEQLMHSDDDFINQKDGIEKGNIPVFQKNNDITHVLYKEVRYHYLLDNLLKQSPDLKLILLVRNPLAVLYSWYTAPKEFRRELGWVFEDEWLSAPKKNLGKVEEYNGYEKWKEATLLFHQLHQDYPDQVFLLKYQHLLKHTQDIVEQIFSFVGLSMHEQTLKFISASQSVHHEDAYSVFKKRTNDDQWKQLPQSIIDYIRNDLKSTSLESYLHE
ncbi:sulfotransferase domain-containing protein [Flavobacteriaceae bacterium MAR_2010_105]|nr:sulfotransferase domain-containing protein [Flavobacteriaceae bacterium MAR_2010_105]